METKKTKNVKKLTTQEQCKAFHDLAIACSIGDHSDYNYGHGIFQEIIRTLDTLFVEGRVYNVRRSLECYFPEYFTKKAIIDDDQPF